MITFALLTMIVAFMMIATLVVFVASLILASPTLALVGIIAIDLMVCGFLIGVIKRIAKKSKE